MSTTRFSVRKIISRKTCEVLKTSQVSRGLTEIQYIMLDALDALSGRREPLIPPRRLMHDGPRDPAIFKENGAEFFRYYVELCRLKPAEAILDVGCGIGRKTLPLLNYLEGGGRYEGFDINQVSIKWCQKVIESKYPNFHFQWIDLFNQRYNPGGKYKAAEYKFPFSAETFDFVVLGSVFTHMWPEEVKNYLSEVARVLKREGGRCLISYFLLNPETLTLIKQKSALNFQHNLGDCWINDINLPENAIGYDEAYILDLYERCGLQVQEPIHYGSWCPRNQVFSQKPGFSLLSYQDLIIASKLEPSPVQKPGF